MTQISERKTDSYVLVIDLGSGGPKAAVVADNGHVLASSFERIETELLPNGGAEQDADEWWRCSKMAIKKALKDSAIDPAKIAMISCDSQWSVIVPVDISGNPLMKAVHWLDTRGGIYNRKITAGFPSLQGYGIAKLIKWIRLTGFAPTHSGLDSLGHILYIKNELPDIYHKTFKFLEPMDFITSRLTGRFTASQHSMITVMTVNNRRWSSTEYHRGLIRLAGIDAGKLPELLPNNGIIGPITPSVAKELGLRETVQVMTGINDTNASVVGAGAVEKYAGVIYIGTSLVLTCHLPFKKTDIFHMLATFPSPLESQHLLFAEQGAGGKTLEYFLENIVYSNDEFNTGTMPENACALADRMAERIPAGSGGVIFLPWLNGSIVPVENVNARGAFFNLSLGTTRGHLARAVLESLAYNIRWTLGPAEKFISRKFTHIRFAGGGAQSDIWAQIHADVLGIPMHQVSDPYHTTIRGAGLLAFHRMGIRAADEIPGLVAVKRVFEPDESSRKVYDKMFQQYCELFKRNRKVFKALNG